MATDSNSAAATTTTTTATMTTMTDKLTFTPLHRTNEVENIHAQVNQHDPNHVEQTVPVNRKVLMKHMTVIGGGHEVDIERSDRR